MRNHKATILLLVFMITSVVSILLSGCSETSSSKAKDYEQNTVGMEARLTEANQKRLMEVQPPPELKYSAERENLIKRLIENSDPNRIGYAYLIDQGIIIGEFVVKGKVSSMNSRLTTNFQIITLHVGGSYTTAKMESPDFDGTYGLSEEGIFFYTVDGNRVDWNGRILYSTQPMSLAIRPLLVRQVK